MSVPHNFLTNLFANRPDGPVETLALLDAIRQELATILDRSTKIASGQVTTIKTVAQLISAEKRRRVRRTGAFGADLFSDPAWDMLIVLIDAHLKSETLSVSSLSYAANIPQTTGLRWIEAFMQLGWIDKQNDPKDKRRILLRLAPTAVEELISNMAKALG